MSSFKQGGSYYNRKENSFPEDYINYIVENELDFEEKDQAEYEDENDGDVPQVTYMVYVFKMQDRYETRQKEEKAKAEAFSKVFQPIDRIIMEYLQSKTNNKPYIEDPTEKDAIITLDGFTKAEKNFINWQKETFPKQQAKPFFEYIKRDSGPSMNIRKGDTDIFMQGPIIPSTPMRNSFVPVRMATGLNIAERDKILSRDEISALKDNVIPMGGGHRRSHKPSQKKTSKGKSRSRSRSRSRSKTRSKSKSKSKTRAKSKSKKR